MVESLVAFPKRSARGGRTFSKAGTQRASGSGGYFNLPRSAGRFSRMGSMEKKPVTVARSKLVMSF